MTNGNGNAYYQVVLGFQASLQREVKIRQKRELRQPSVSRAPPLASISQKYKHPRVPVLAEITEDIERPFS